MIHVIAFNKNLLPGEILKNKKVVGEENYYENLEMLSKHGDLSSAYYKGHWLEAMLPNDIMTPYSRQNQILTIYTLEMIENYCHKFETISDFLPSNWLWDSIDSKIDFFNYNCKNETGKFSKYSTYCLKNQALTNAAGCSGDYLHKTICENEVHANNCYINAAQEFGTCIDPSLKAKNEAIESFGLRARCTKTSVNFSLCLDYRLEEKKIGGKLEVEVYVKFGETEYQCVESEGVIPLGDVQINGRKQKVSIVCPHLPKFITFFKKTNCQDNCHDNGFCSDGKCICYEGYEEKNHCEKAKSIAKNFTNFSEML